MTTSSHPTMEPASPDSHPALVPLSQLISHMGDRLPDLQHVLDLAESIAAIGLISPITVDCLNRVVAGRHRYMAIALLSMNEAERQEQLQAWLRAQPRTDRKLAALGRSLKALPPREGLLENYTSVPVYHMAFDSEMDADRTLKVEISENEKRRSYSKREITELAARLKRAGYRHQRGRPRAGEKALGPALQVITGKSRSAINKQLRDENVSSDRKPPSLKNIKGRVRKVLDLLQHSLEQEGVEPHFELLSAITAFYPHLGNRADAPAA